MSDDAYVLARLEEMVKGPNPYDVLSEWTNAAPGPWKDMTPGRMLIVLRCHLRVTQDEVAKQGGLTQSQVSRLEGDEDALMSTWRRVYAALGFNVLLMPTSALDWDKLERRAERMRPARRRFQERARSRR